MCYEQQIVSVQLLEQSMELAEEAASNRNFDGLLDAIVAARPHADDLPSLSKRQIMTALLDQMTALATGLRADADASEAEALAAAIQVFVTGGVAFPELEDVAA